MKKSDQAQVLAQALPYIKKFRNKSIVVKVGGNALTEQGLKNSFAHDVTWLQSVGINITVIHGGGPQIKTQMDKLGKTAHFVEGMRVTDAETMDIVEMVLAGGVNKEIVELINHKGGKAVGLTGQDGGLIRAQKMTIKSAGGENQSVDIGLVGEIKKINPEVLFSLQKSGFIPVIAPIASGFDGETYNVNADVVAGKLSQVLQAEKLVLLTNTSGVLDNDGQLINHLTAKGISEMLEKEQISEGMIPKITSALDAAKNGVRTVHIIDGRVKNCLLLEIL